MSRCGVSETRRRGLAHGASLALVVAACGPSEATCTKACARPYELLRTEGGAQRAAWEAFPEPQRKAALSVYAAWSAQLQTAEEAFTASCVAVCKTRSAEVVECLGRAKNTGEWKACGKS